MGRWVAVLLVLFAGSVSAAKAAERSPATLMPAEVLFYHELNLAQWHGSSQGPVSLDQVFEQSGLMPGQRAVAGNIPIPGPMDNLKNSLSLMWEALQFVGPRLGFTTLPGMPGTQPPGAGGFLAVAEVKDAAALTESARRILRDNQITYQEETRGDGVKVLTIAMGPAIAIGPDWAALGNPPGLLDTVIQLAASGGKGSLAADPHYQRAIKGLPREALIIQYASPMMFSFMSELITSASRPAPGVPLPAAPEDGIAWAIRASVESQDGRRMLSLTWTTDADTASSLTSAAIFAAMFPVFDRGAQSARKVHCSSNVKDLSIAMDLYVTDHGTFPEAGRWTAELREYIGEGSVLQCPDDHSGAACSYGMNAGLSGKPKSAIKDGSRQVVIYETAHPGPCPSGGRDDIASPPRHLGGNNFGFADGHAKWFSEKETQAPAADW